MREQLPALIVLLPLLTALATPLISYFSKSLTRILAILALLGANLCAIGSLIHALEIGTWHYKFGGWTPPWGIEYVIDPLSGTMAVLVCFISLVVLIYSGAYIKDYTWLRRGMYYTLYLLLTVGLLGMIVTGDVFNLYVFLEISSLTAYGLIAAGGHKGTVAAFRYLMIGTIGASFYLLGVGYLYAVTGSLNMADLAVQLQPIIDSPAVMIAVVMILIGMGIKMGLFPMHGWLPDSYTYAAPTAVPFIAGVMTKVSAYVVFRFFYYVLGAMKGPVPQALTILGWAAAVGIILGSIMAIAQSDFRRMLAYSSIAQVSYIALGLAIGNVYGLIGAVFHILNHAITKSCLFLIAGGVKWKTGEHSIYKYAEMSKKMPLTMGAFLIAAFSMVGLPPTAGFFSKWYLVLGAVEKNMWPFVVVIVLSSLLNAIYFFRVIEHAFMKKDPEYQSKSSKGIKELPITMLIPIIALSLGIIVVGVCNAEIVTKVLQFAVPGGGF